MHLYAHTGTDAVQRAFLGVQRPARHGYAAGTPALANRTHTAQHGTQQAPRPCPAQISTALGRSSARINAPRCHQHFSVQVIGLGREAG